MDSEDFEIDLYKSIMDKDLTEIEPYLEKIELILPSQLIRPISSFRLRVKASGSDLLCNGSWFKISVAEDEYAATIISQPQGETLSYGMIGEWQVEVQAPIEEGNYWIFAIIDSVETDTPIVKIPFTVTKPKKNLSHGASYFQPKTLQIAVFGSLISCVLLLFFVEMTTVENLLKQYLQPALSESTIKPNPTIKTVSVEKRSAEVVSSKLEDDTKRTEWVANVLEQSFYHPSVIRRQNAWRKINEYIDSQIDTENPIVQEILSERVLYKKQLKYQLTSNKNPRELIKRIQVLAFVDDDKTAQRWLGDLYLSGKIVTQHLGRAWQWYQRAANKGDPEAQNLLEKLEARADQLLTSSNYQDRMQGYQVTEEAASAGGINAQLWMGYRYETGDGVTHNLVVAENWYRKAAEQGNAFARKMLFRIKKGRSELKHSQDRF